MKRPRPADPVNRNHARALFRRACPFALKVEKIPELKVQDMIIVNPLGEIIEGVAGLQLSK